VHTAAADAEHWYRAVRSRDPRFDGVFFVGVVSTGIYCRPSCPATTPLRRNVRFYRSAAAAQGAGFRACHRCRPDSSPGSPEWNVRADVVGRAIRLIADGVVDRDGVPALARRLGYSERHLHRQLVGELGAGPLALARAQRAAVARLLLESTTLPITDVAFAAGFGSIRQFNDTVREVFALSPTQLRASSRWRPVAPGALSVRLPYRAPFAATELFTFLAARAVPGVEEYDGTTFRRSLALPHGPAIVELTPAAGHVQADLHLQDLRDLAAAIARCRRLLDLDADPAAVDGVLGEDPVLAPLVAARPGLRVPGAVDGAELAVRAVLGQQVSVAAARTLAGRLAAAHGEPLPSPRGGVSTTFPTPQALAAADPSGWPLPRARARTLSALAQALAGGLTLDPGAERAGTIAALRELPGIGAWTAQYLGMRALADPDVLLDTDLGLRRAAARLGLPGTPAALTERSAAWRPWRSYAVLHLWSPPQPESLPQQERKPR